MTQTSRAYQLLTELENTLNDEGDRAFRIRLFALPGMTDEIAARWQDLATRCGRDGISCLFSDLRRFQESAYLPAPEPDKEPHMEPNHYLTACAPTLPCGCPADSGLPYCSACNPAPSGEAVAGKMLTHVALHAQRARKRRRLCRQSAILLTQVLACIGAATLIILGVDWLATYLESLR